MKGVWVGDFSGFHIYEIPKQGQVHAMDIEIPVASNLGIPHKQHVAPAVHDGTCRLVRKTVRL